MSLNYSLLVFDWDGTLMDSESHIVACLQSAIDAMGLEPLPSRSLSNVIGLGLHEAIAQLYPEAEASTIANFINHYRNHFLSEQQPTRLFPGTKTLLEELHSRGYLMAVATGKSRRGLDRSLTETECQHLFHISRCADECFSKPHPQMLLEIMAELDVNPEKTLMIGDTEYDMLMAASAGTAALAVDYGVHDRQRLLSMNPLHCLSDIRELLEWLN